MTEPATLAREIVAGCDHVGFRSDQDYWHAAYEKPGACEDCIAAALRPAPPSLERSRLEGNAIGQPTSVVTHDSEGRGMNEHTPGPWRHTEGNVTNADGSEMIAHCVGRVDLVMANARLIAAAPELLAACRLIDDCDHYEDGRIVVTRADMDAVRVAIAKARG